MKKVYYKPEMTVVAVNQRQTLLNSSPVSAGPGSDFMSNPTISSGAGARQNDSDWDDD